MVVSLFWCFHAFKDRSPLRVDLIPLNAYIVPWMKPNPSIAELKAMGVPWDIDEVMAGALKINVTFKIECEYDSIKETRVIPSIIYLGHDMECLYIGGKFIGMFTNPASKPDEMHPNFLDVFFDVANDGKLTFPEAGSRLSITVYNHTWKTSGWFHDLVWVEKEDLGRKWIGWLFAEDYHFPKGVPGFIGEKTPCPWKLKWKSGMSGAQ